MTAPRPLFNGMKLRLWLRQRSISAPQMTISRQWSWRGRTGVLLAVLGGVVAVGVAGYGLGRNFAGPQSAPGGVELATAKQEVAKVSAERDQYSSTVNAAESELNIERAAQKQLAAQIKVLERENSKLKEDLAFFERLLPAEKGAAALSIRRLQADISGPNQVRYRLLVMQGGKGERDFNGSLQLAATVVQAGKSAMITIPDAAARDAETAEKFKLAFKHYQRIEGLLTLPEGAELKSLQARILEKGQVRVQQTAILERSQ